MPIISEEESLWTRGLHQSPGDQQYIQYFLKECVKAGAWQLPSEPPIADVPAACQQKVIGVQSWNERVKAAELAAQAQRAEYEARPWIAKEENWDDIAVVAIPLLAVAVGWMCRSYIRASGMAVGRFVAKLLYALTGYRVSDTKARWRDFDKKL